MVFTLFVEVISLHVRPTAVDIQGFNLEFVSQSTFGGVKKCLDDSIHVLLAISISTRIMRNGKRKSLRKSEKSFRLRRCFRSHRSFVGCRVI